MIEAFGAAAAAEQKGLRGVFNVRHIHGMCEMPAAFRWCRILREVVPHWEMITFSAERESRAGKSCDIAVPGSVHCHFGKDGLRTIRCGGHYASHLVIGPNRGNGGTAEEDVDAGLLCIFEQRVHLRLNVPQAIQFIGGGGPIDGLVHLIDEVGIADREPGPVSAVPVSANAAHGPRAAKSWV